MQQGLEICSWLLPVLEERVEIKLMITRKLQWNDVWLSLYGDCTIKYFVILTRHVIHTWDSDKSRQVWYIYIWPVPCDICLCSSRCGDQVGNILHVGDTAPVRGGILLPLWTFRTSEAHFHLHLWCTVYHIRCVTQAYTNTVTQHSS
jgi:hypothetical protein